MRGKQRMLFEAVAPKLVITVLGRAGTSRIMYSVQIAAPAKGKQFEGCLLLFPKSGIRDLKPPAQFSQRIPAIGGVDLGLDPLQWRFCYLCLPSDKRN